MTGKRFVNVDDEVDVAIPYSETSARMQVAEHVVRVRVLEGGQAQIWQERVLAPGWSVTVDHATAGIHRDDSGRLWVAPIPDQLWVAALKGEPQSPLMTSSDAADRWILKHQSQSVDQAKRYDGWSVQAARYDPE